MTRRGMRALPCAMAVLLLAVGHAPAEGPEAGATVRGQLELGLDGARLGNLGPIVVFLTPVEGEAHFAPPERSVTVEQRNARFSPAFRAVVRGQTVEMPNADAIYHNVFSYSRPNDFDLGIYPAGESRSVVLEHPGVVKTYCSIHESMNATIFVSPTPWFDVVGPSGEFTLRAVPPGRYVLRTWSEKLPDTERFVDVSPTPGPELLVQLGPRDDYAPSWPASRSSNASGGKGRQ